MMSTLSLPTGPDTTARDRGGRRPDVQGRGSSPGSGSDASEPATASIAGASPTAPASGAQVRATLLRVAWLAVGLGLVIEVSLLLVALFLNTGQDAKPFLADLVQRVSWSVLICVGLAFAGAATKGSAPAMGLTGLLAAPTATVIARTLHKWMGQSIGLAMADPSGVAFFLIPTVRGLEYAFLGAALAWIGRRPWGGAIAHVALGLGVGIAFGGMVLTVNAPTSTSALLSTAINEVVAPLGCALTLFAGKVLGTKAEG